MKRAHVAGVAAMVVLAAGGMTAFLARRAAEPAQSSVATLASAARGRARSIEARLSGGFAWSRFDRSARADDLGLRAAVAEVIATSRTSPTPKSLHEAGVAELLAGRPRPALERLREVARGGGDPFVWSDLAAALHEAAVRLDAPDLLAEALAASDRALAIDARMPEARFNRALVIERLGLRDDAREAWRAYLAIDPASEWSDEARMHEQGLAPLPLPEQMLDGAERRFAAGDEKAASELAELDSATARGRGVMTTLARWAEAVVRHDESAAAAHLRFARALGAAVARSIGDHLLERSVAAIDDATGSERDALVRAHLDFRAGLEAFQANRPRDAEVVLRRAAVGFERGGSPMAGVANYFAANTTFEQGRAVEAQRQLQKILAATPRDLPALRALVEWEIGVCLAFASDWGGSLASLERSAAALTELRDIEHAGAVQRIIAWIYDRNGDRESAWRHRVASLRGVGGRSGLPLEKSVSSIADAAMLRGEWRTAESFLTLQAGISRRIGDDVQLALAHHVRAAVRYRLDDRAAALADAAEGERVDARVADAAYREELRDYATRVRALLAPSAGEAVSLWTACLSRASKMDLPGLYLERARALRRAGDLDAARADLGKGMSELETQRASLPEGAARWGAFHAAEDLFADAIDAALEQNDVAAAFAAAERARARALLEAYGDTRPFDHRSLPRGTTVVEYAVLPSHLVIFTADAGGLHATTVPVTRDQLAADADALVRAARGDDAAAMKSAAVGLSAKLVAPVAGRIAAAESLVFVSDSVTSAVPFAALVDANEFLVQRHVIVTAPSAAVFSVASERQQRARTPQSILLVVSSEAGGDTAALPFVRSEAREVAKAYGSSRTVDEDTGLESIGHAAASTDVIHFAGHAVGDDSGLEPASLLLRQNGEQHRVRVSEIAKLHLPRTSLVVLAGCSTARGERRAGEGAISVAHGFLSAGVPSVIATLWPIDDRAAAAFFPRLHASLAAGKSPADALRAAQLEAIRSGNVPTALWAALQDVGS